LNGLLQGTSGDEQGHEQADIGDSGEKETAQIAEEAARRPQDHSALGAEPQGLGKVQVPCESEGQRFFVE